MTFVSWHLILIGQLLLEAPDDIYSFQFSPSDPNIICGGCYNGQVVLWDISAHADRLKQPRGGNRNKKSNVLVSDELISYKMMSVFVHYCTHRLVLQTYWLGENVCNTIFTAVTLVCCKR